MGVWLSEPMLDVIVDALQTAAEDREARLDGSCTDCTNTGLCGDHAADVEAAMRYRDAIDEIEQGTDLEHLLGDLHPEFVGGVVDVSRVVRAALHAAARSGALLGQVILSGEVIDEPVPVEATDGPAALTRVSLTESSPATDAATVSWLDSAPVVVDVVAYGQLARNVTRSVTKGTPVEVTGTYRPDSPHGSPVCGGRSTADRRALVASSIAVSLRAGTVVYRPHAPPPGVA